METTGGDYYSNNIQFVWRMLPGQAVIQQLKGQEYGPGLIQILVPSLYQQ